MRDSRLFKALHGVEGAQGAPAITSEAPLKPVSAPPSADTGTLFKALVASNAGDPRGNPDTAPIGGINDSMKPMTPFEPPQPPIMQEVPVQDPKAELKKKMMQALIQGGKRAFTGGK